MKKKKKKEKKKRKEGKEEKGITANCEETRQSKGFIAYDSLPVR